MPEFDVLSANLHNRRGPVRVIRRWSQHRGKRFAFAFLSEAQDRAGMLRRFPEHRYHTGPKSADRNMTQETGVLVTDSMPNLGHGYFYIADEYAPAPKIGPERWGQVAVVRRGNLQIAGISLHPIAGPEKLHHGPADSGIVERYQQAMDWLDTTISAQMSFGRDVIVGMDCQMREGWDAAWSPRHIFDRHRMVYFWHGIDVIAASQPYKITDTEAVDIGSDHLCLRAHLRRGN